MTDKNLNPQYRLGFEDGKEYYKEKINTPRLVIQQQWKPSRCPTCGEYFDDYEDCNDGYYKRAYNLNRCPFCGQKIKWELGLDY